MTTAKKTSLGIFGLAILILIGTAIWATLVVRAQVDPVLTTGPDDGRVVAVVDGIEISFGAIRRTAAAEASAHPDYTAEQAFDSAVVGVLQQYAAYAEARERGLMVTDSDVTAHIQRTRELCEHPDNTECRDAITTMGKTMDEYFADTVEGYRRGLSVGRLKRAVLQERGVIDGSDQVQIEVWQTYLAGVPAMSRFEWRDEAVREAFQGR